MLNRKFMPIIISIIFIPNIANASIKEITLDSINNNTYQELKCNNEYCYIYNDKKLSTINYDGSNINTIPINKQYKVKQTKYLYLYDNQEIIMYEPKTLKRINSLLHNKGYEYNIIDNDKYIILISTNNGNKQIEIYDTELNYINKLAIPDKYNIYLNNNTYIIKETNKYKVYDINNILLKEMPFDETNKITESLNKKYFYEWQPNNKKIKIYDENLEQIKTKQILDNIINIKPITKNEILITTIQDGKEKYEIYNNLLEYQEQTTIETISYYNNLPDPINREYIPFNKYQQFINYIKENENIKETNILKYGIECQNQYYSIIKKENTYYLIYSNKYLQEYQKLEIDIPFTTNLEEINIYPSNEEIIVHLTSKNEQQEHTLTSLLFKEIKKEKENYFTNKVIILTTLIIIFIVLFIYMVITKIKSIK